MPDRNVIVVVVDALRADRLGVLGSDRDLTPNVDDLANEGVVFENAFACTNATDPSMTSIHTGRDPSGVVYHHGPFVTDEEKRRAEAATSFPEAAQEAGVATLATGRLLSRWHKSGFDRYPEAALSRNRRRKMGQRLEALHPGLRATAGWMYERLVEPVLGGEETDEIDEFLDLVEDEPFYGLVHMMDTHAPYEPDGQLVEEVLARGDYPTDDLSAFFDRHADNNYVNGFLGEHAEPADYDYGLGRLHAKYDAAVLEADAKVGRLVAGLRDRGLLESTVVVVTSDHGESLDEHGIFFDHHGLYDQSIRVPLVVAGPGVESGRRDETVQLYDLGETVLDLLGVDAALGGEGRSLVPLLTGEGDWEEREFVVAREAHAQSRVAIRTAGYKLIRHVEDPVLERERGDSFRCGYCDTVHGDELELYDLGSDPDETNDLSEERPGVVEELLDRLETYEGRIQPPTPGDDTPVEYEEESEVLDRLEDLGYR